MTQEERQLLLKDLYSRIPYDTVVYVNGNGDVYLDSVDWYEEVKVRDYRTCTYPIDDVKPYLRPMNSMTEKKAIEMFHTVCPDVETIGVEINEDRVVFKTVDKDGHFSGHTVLFFNNVYSLNQMDWLNENHFDYRGLIPMGLALEAPKGMYKEED